MREKRSRGRLLKRLIFCAFYDIIKNIAVNGDCFCFLKKRENEMRRKNVGSEKGKKAPKRGFVFRHIPIEYEKKEYLEIGGFRIGIYYEKARESRKDGESPLLVCCFVLDNGEEPIICRISVSKRFDLKEFFETVWLPVIKKAIKEGKLFPKKKDSPIFKSLVYSKSGKALLKERPFQAFLLKGESGGLIPFPGINFGGHHRRISIPITK